MNNEAKLHIEALWNQTRRAHFFANCFGSLIWLSILTALLYGVNHAVGPAAWIRICTAIALLCWGGFAWAKLKISLGAWVRTRWIAFFARCFILVALLILIDVALGVTYPASAPVPQPPTPVPATP